MKSVLSTQLVAMFLEDKGPLSVGKTQDRSGVGGREDLSFFVSVSFLSLSLTRAWKVVGYPLLLLVGVPMFLIRHRYKI